MLTEFLILLPEIALTCVILALQLYGVFSNKSQKVASVAILLVLAMLGLMFYAKLPEGMFSDYFVASAAIGLIKSIILALSLLAIVIYRNSVKITHSELKVEFITLTLFATLGAFISISSRDFLLLFCGLELQSLASYTLASFDSRNLRSTESGMKYFVLGSLVSCLFLFGVSLLYGSTGTVIFSNLTNIIASQTNIITETGLILVLAAILFKLSAAPMHVWTPDVYQGSPISAVTFFASSQKIGILVVLLNILDIVPENLTIISVDLMKIVAILSMLIGALGAIKQESLKRLMAYSTILNVGYVLIGVCLNDTAGRYAAFVYMLIYVVSVIGFFACLVSLFGSKADEATFDDLRDMATNRKALALAISTIMFSMIGLPPLAGFFGKYYLFLHAIKQGEFVLALIGVITSVIAAFYYLRVVKYIYFMERDDGEEMTLIPTNTGLLLVSGSVIFFIVFFFLFGSSYLLF